ncbi:MAG: hypothetical protein FWH21_07695, partial [Kiritimatiellaeota bacterium]|nr:hypothetical protein [Kiritimatiellota bacterium]
MKTKTKVVCGSVAAAVTLAVQVGCKQGVTDEPLEVVSVKNAERGSVLQELARQTGGQYYGGLTNAMDSRFAMEEAYAQIADRTLFLKGTVVPAQVKRNNKETGTLSPERIRVPFLVDSFIRRLDVTVGYFGGEEEASLVLQKPDGSTITPHISPTPDGLTMLDFIVHDSLAGEWAIVGTRKPGTRIEYFAYITTSGGPYLSWLAMEESPDGGEYLIVVALRGDVSIEGAKVVGE